MKRVTGSIVLVLAAAGFSAAGVNVGVSTPNASIYVGTPQPAPQVTVVERERVVVEERQHEEDNGKHKGHYKHKKHKKERHDEKGEKGEHGERGEH